MNQTEYLNIQGMMSVIGIVTLIVGIYLFISTYPDLIFGLIVLLIVSLVDAFWIKIASNNDLGNLHLLGTPLMVIGLIAIDLSGSWGPIFIKITLFAIIFWGALLSFTVIEKAD